MKKPKKTKTNQARGGKKGSPRSSRTASKDAGVQGDSAERRSAQLMEVVRWALGEHPTEEFPGLPDDWPARKFYWRGELRARLNRILKESEK